MAHDMCDQANANTDLTDWSSILKLCDADANSLLVDQSTQPVMKCENFNCTIVIANTDSGQYEPKNLVHLCEKCYNYFKQTNRMRTVQIIEDDNLRDILASEGTILATPTSKLQPQTAETARTAQQISSSQETGLLSPAGSPHYSGSDEATINDPDLTVSQSQYSAKGTATGILSQGSTDSHSSFVGKSLASPEKPTLNTLKAKKISIPPSAEQRLCYNKYCRAVIVGRGHKVRSNGKMYCSTCGRYKVSHNNRERSKALVERLLEKRNRDKNR